MRLWWDGAGVRLFNLVGVVMSELKNGERWKQPKFPYFGGITQWLFGDQWVLMSEPYKTRYGHMAVMPTSEGDGHILFTEAELLARLHKNHYERCEGTS